MARSALQRQLRYVTRLVEREDVDAIREASDAGSRLARLAEDERIPLGFEGSYKEALKSQDGSPSPALNANLTPAIRW